MQNNYTIVVLLSDVEKNELPGEIHTLPKSELSLRNNVRILYKILIYYTLIHYFNCVNIYF